MNLPRVYADFNKQDEKGRLVLTCAGTQRDLDRLGLTLSDGLRLLFYADDTDENGELDDIQVEGIVRYDEVSKRWIAEFSQTDIHHASERRSKSGSP